jgi:O-methyltransferase involved in polyketide biosynthesis
MVESSPSRTAMVTSLMRALHSRSDPSPLLDDPWGDQLVPKSEREKMRQRILVGMDSDARARALRTPDSILDEFLLTNAAYPGVVIRSRYAAAGGDNRGCAPVCPDRRRVRQLRTPPPGLFRRPANLRKIDHPATQMMKIQRIRECGISLPRSVHFIAADLAKEDLVAALASSSFRRDEAAFFSLLGVTVYLTREANLATLRAVSTCGSRGSELVFTYVDQIEFALGGSRSPYNKNAQAVAMMGEPYVSGFDPNEIANDLTRVGLELVEDLDGATMSARYARSGANIPHPPASMHIALARVGQGLSFGTGS